MTKARSSPKRNVESIRQKNLEDNQLFLKQLLMTEIRKDFAQSARSILRKKETTKISVEYIKVEHATRYNLKVKSGEIAPHVPEWQREIERKKLEKEQQRQERERKREEELLKKERRKQKEETERQERLLEQELKKIERQLQYEEQRRRRGPSKWELLYKDKPYQRPHRLCRTRINEQIE